MPDINSTLLNQVAEKVWHEMYERLGAYTADVAACAIAANAILRRGGNAQAEREMIQQIRELLASFREQKAKFDAAQRTDTPH